jgi:hypothetical protein
MNETTPRISIVMPSFNQAEFLTAAVLSVLESAADDVELVVADGASTDGTQALLADLALRFPGRLRWQSAPDGGPAAAINDAVRRARAPLLGWLNSDDLYAPGAITRALAHFATHPDDVMAYGQATHVDIAGQHLEAYPTRPPDTPIEAFRDGCFICQPSAFFRRDAFLALGGLDEGLKAAFDFDLWLRMFRTHPGRIGFVDSVQAHSRLHEGGITLRFRERVAREGIQVVARHLGTAPVHWLLTHLQELVASHPFTEAVDTPAARITAMAEELAPVLEPGSRLRVAEHLAGHWGAALAGPHWAVPVWADGWAPARLDVRVRQPADAGVPPLPGLRLHGLHAHPRGGVLQLVVHGPEGRVAERRLDVNGPFTIDLPLSDRRPGARTVFSLCTEGGFVPQAIEPGSADQRTLAFRVERVQVRP